MCYGDVASQNGKFENENVVVVEDVYVGGDDENDDNRIDDDMSDNADYAENDIHKLHPEVCDFRKRFLYNFVFAHVNLNSLRHKYAFVRDMLK